MNAENSMASYDVVDEEGDVVSSLDIEDIQASSIAHLDSDLDLVYALTLESSLRSHPSTQDMSEPEISKLGQELINELLQKPFRKGQAILTVLRNPDLSSKDRSAIALEAGLPADIFNEQPEAREVLGSKKGASGRRYEQQSPDFIDIGKLAANDRD